MGSSDFNLLVPDFPLGGSILSVLLVGPESGVVLQHATWDVTFTSPPGGTLAANIIMELHVPLEAGIESWVVTGTDFGWPAATGTYTGRISSDAYNGVLSGGLFGFTTPELFLSATTGGIDGQFLGSTISLELAPDVCQANLGFGGLGALKRRADRAAALTVVCTCDRLGVTPSTGSFRRAAQAQRIRQHRHRAQAHRCGGDHGAEQ
ncbi:MAG: hypothetical protein ACT4PU_09180 [Planctomycetota bacterium]